MNSLQMMPITPVVKRIIIATALIWFVVQVVIGAVFKINIWQPLTLVPAQVIESFHVWQLFTYMFLHALSPFHIFFNLLMLYFFGSELEKHWGSKFFTIYYFSSGVGAAILYCIATAIYSGITSVRTPLVMPVIGASGALFGLLLAYGIIFSERVMYFMGLFPLKAKYFVMIAGAIDLASLLSSGFAGSEVAYLAHLGGLVSGFIVLKVHIFFKSKAVSQKLKRKNSALKLVIDNEKSEEKNDPKYWN